MAIIALFIAAFLSFTRANYIHNSAGLFVGPNLDYTSSGPLPIYFKPLKGTTKQKTEKGKNKVGVLVTADNRILSVGRGNKIELRELIKKTSWFPKKSTPIDKLKEIAINENDIQNVAFLVSKDSGSDTASFMHGNKCLSWGPSELELNSCKDSRSRLAFPEDNKTPAPTEEPKLEDIQKAAEVLEALEESSGEEEEPAETEEPNPKKGGSEKKAESLSETDKDVLQSILKQLEREEAESEAAHTNGPRATQGGNYPVSQNPLSSNPNLRPGDPYYGQGFNPYQGNPPYGQAPGAPGFNPYQGNPPPYGQHPGTQGFNPYQNNPQNQPYGQGFNPYQGNQPGSNPPPYGQHPGTQGNKGQYPGGPPNQPGAIDTIMKPEDRILLETLKTYIAQQPPAGQKPEPGGGESELRKLIFEYLKRNRLVTERIGSKSCMPQLYYTTEAPAEGIKNDTYTLELMIQKAIAEKELAVKVNQLIKEKEEKQLKGDLKKEREKEREKEKKKKPKKSGGILSKLGPLGAIAKMTPHGQMAEMLTSGGGDEE